MFDISHLSPQRRAIIKLTGMLALMTSVGAVTAIALNTLGLETVIYILGTAITLFILRTMYQIQLGQEQYRDELKSREKNG